jgi:AcrR family transcriptional regulator
MARRRPRQARSRDLVEAIFGATSRVLDRAGLARLSVNSVVRHAGVSPGSFYQYFANRDDLLDAYVAWNWAGLEREFVARVRGGGDLAPLAADLVGTYVAWIRAARLPASRLRATALPAVIATRDRLCRLLATTLRAAAPAPPGADAEATTDALTVAVEALAESADSSAQAVQRSLLVVLPVVASTLDQR